MAYRFPPGLKIEVSNRAEWLAFTDIFVDGIHDTAITPALANFDGNLNLLDLGANVGYSRFASSISALGISEAAWLRRLSPLRRVQVFAVNYNSGLSPNSPRV
jgi:hypothetical protein